ncbi:MAG: BatA domain-containing protein, partial [Candidatus Firestonebacteria bacterium]
MNISFINAGLLFALPLVLVPVLIHLFSIKNSRVKKFPETKYIALALKKSITRIHLLQLLLLLLRILIVALLVFFFARAVLHKNAHTSGAASPEAYYLLLDNSYSMGAVNKNGSSFERGKAACLRVLKGLRNIDSVSFSLFSKGAEPQLKGLTSDLAEVEKRIRVSGLSCKTTSIRSGLSSALAAMKQTPGVSKQIIVVTDLALHGYAQFDFAPGELDPKINIIFIDVGEAPDNLAVSNPSAAVSSFEDRLKFKADISGYAVARYSKVPVTLLLNGQKAAYGFAEVKPGRKTVKTLYAGAGGNETAAGSVKIEVNDALALDNTSYFTVSGRQLKKILLVDGDSKISAFLSETFYLNLALNPNQRFSSEILPSVCVLNELKNKNLSEYKAVILCNIPTLLPVEAGALLTYVKNGGNLVYFLGDKIELKNYAVLDSALFPAVISGEEEGNIKIDEKTISSNHPVFKNTGVEELGKVTFSRVYRLAPKSKCFSYLDFAGLNCPAFLEA